MGDLFFHIQKYRKFPEEKAKFYFSEIAYALSSLHVQNILYLDLKPENVLMDDKGHVILTDFGFSFINSLFQLFDIDITQSKIEKNIESDPKKKIVTGTPEYLCFEIYEIFLSIE